MSLLFSCRFLGQVKLIINPHEKENLDHQNNDVGRGLLGKETHQNKLETFYIYDRFMAFDRPIIST